MASPSFKQTPIGYIGVVQSKAWVSALLYGLLGMASKDTGFKCFSGRWFADVFANGVAHCMQHARSREGTSYVGRWVLTQLDRRFCETLKTPDYQIDEHAVSNKTVYAITIK